MDSEHENSTLYALGLDEAILAKSIAFGSGTVFTEAHDCGKCSRESTVTPVLAIRVTDVDDTEHTIVIQKDSAIARALADMDIYYEIRSLMEFDN